MNFAGLKGQFISAPRQRHGFNMFRMQYVYRKYGCEKSIGNKNNEYNTSFKNIINAIKSIVIMRMQHDPNLISLRNEKRAFVGSYDKWQTV